MSATGSLMIRNLRKKSDYDKAVITQNELLNIASSNIANIANARRDFQQGILPQALPQTKKSPVELQADLGLQQSTAIQNLSQLFKYPEISSILGGLTNDEVFIINQSFPSIKKDIESKFNTDLVTPSFFVDYIKKYILELNESKGVSTNLSNMTNKFNQLTTDIRDIQKYLPPVTLLVQLRRDLQNLDFPLSQISPILSRLYAIEENMIDPDDFYKIAKKGDVERSDILNMIQTITTDMPTQDDLIDLHEQISNHTISNEEILQRMDGLANSLSNLNIRQLAQVRQRIKERETKEGKEGDYPSIKRTRSQPITPSKYEIVQLIDNPSLLAPIPNLIQMSWAHERNKSGDLSDKDTIYFIYADGVEDKISNEDLKRFYRNNREFKDWSDSVLSVPKGKKAPSIIDIKFFIKGNGAVPKKGGLETMSTDEFMAYLDAEQSLERPRAEGDTNPTTQIGATTSKKGVGLPIYNGARPKKVVKIGKGVDINKEPLYKTFGKFIVSMPNLVNRDVLHFKYPSLSRIPNLEPVSVSEDFREFFMDTLDNGKVNYKIFKTLDEEEKRLFEKVSEKAGLFKSFGLTKQPDKEDEEEVKRFNILRGEYYAGNNSHQLLDELRILIIKFINKGRIGKNEGISILNSLIH